MTIWRPDTCDCIIEYNDNINWISDRKKCRLHKRLKGQTLLNEVLAQNRRFNLAIPNATEQEEREINAAKTVNTIRIRRENLDNFHEHIPQHHDLTFFENLKRLLGRLNPL